MPIGRARAGKTSKTRPIFRTLTFCLVKRKKKRYIYKFSVEEVKQAMKKLQWIPNTIMMASKLFFLLMDWETITFVRKGQRYKKSSSNTHDSTFDENIYQSKLKAVNYSRKMINLRCLAGSRTCLCWLIQCSF